MIRSFVGLQARSLPRPSCWSNPRCLSSSPSEELSRPSEESVVIEAAKKNIDQSPWKMNFLVKLVRGRWYPDAMAQLKFSPKGKAPDVAKVLQRAAKVANIYHGLIPEELRVKEIWVNKGFMQKKMRIMGRGRTGIGYHRKTHLRVVLEQIDFDKTISECRSKNQKIRWGEKKSLVLQKKAQNAGQTEEAASADGEKQTAE
jgi:large subunit ribosomal protein L22